MSIVTVTLEGEAFDRLVEALPYEVRWERNPEKYPENLMFRTPGYEVMIVRMEKEDEQTDR